MATMIPDIPKEFDAKSHEGIMFDELNQLPEEYYVFHSFEIVTIKENQVLESETDFVIFHPKKGLICLEAKAGQVRFETGYWQYGSGKIMKHNGPYIQAKRNKWNLRDYMIDHGLEYECKKSKQLLETQEQYARDDIKFKELQQCFEAMDQAFRDGQAGILASSLQEGEKCPVCGSTSHPHLAHLSDQVPSEEELNQCKEETEDARTKATDSAQAAGKCKTEFDLLRSKLLEDVEKTLGKSIDFNSNEAEYLSNLDKSTDFNERKNVTNLDKSTDFDERRNVDNLGKLTDSGGLENLSTLLASAKESKTSELAKLQQSIAAENKNLKRKEELEQLIPSLEESNEALKQKIADMDNAISSDQTRLEETKKQQENENKKLTYPSKAEAMKERDANQNKAEALQLAYEQAEQLAHQKSKEVTELKSKIEGYEDTIKSAKPENLEELKDAQKDLNQKIANQDAQAQTVNTRIDTNESTRSHIAAIHEKIAVKETKLQWVTSLADTANGKLKGKDKVMLETYIQMTYFDRIIRRANLRLLKMSGNQYELKRKEEATDSRGQSGLELDVIDHYNGTTRSVKTLSGGESFMASLSLAFGLSDEVQSSAGGIQVDTMFVDEGFGSLDPDALDKAFEALSSLTEGNRLVGIISHVGDLKEKIDKQIIVTKEKSGGSTVKLQV